MKSAAQEQAKVLNSTAPLLQRLMHGIGVAPNVTLGILAPATYLPTQVSTGASSTLGSLAQSGTISSASTVRQSASHNRGTTPTGSDAGGGSSSLDITNIGKKQCQLCQTYIANNPSSFENHACKVKNLEYLLNNN